VIVPVQKRIRGSKYIDMARVVALYFGRFSHPFGLKFLMCNVYDDGTIRIEYYTDFKGYTAEIELDLWKRKGAYVACVPYLWVVKTDTSGWAVVAFRDGKWKKHLKQVYQECISIMKIMTPLVNDYHL